MKRWLYLVHRWLGITLCLVMALWFLSGMVMLYVGYPKLTPAEHLAGLPALPAQGCCVPLAQALRAAGLDGASAASAAADRRGNRPEPDSWRLTSVAGAPRYVFGDARHPVAVDAISGARISGVSATDALASARHFAGGVPGRYLAQRGEDAWTHSRALDAHRPLHVVEVDDADTRWLYVSSRTGEVVRDASFVERSWGWLGAWLHWLYILRGGALNEWWTDIVIALSLAATVGALAGLVIGVLRWRFRGRYKSGHRTPYTGFMERWHHLLGMAGGVLCLTWVLSGLLSVNPWKLFNAPGARPDRMAYAGGPLQAQQAPAAADVLARLQALGHQPRELQWRRLGGDHDVLALGTGGTWVVDATQAHEQAMPQARWRAAAQALLPGTRIVQQQRLTAYDHWYYAREPHTMTGHSERPLPAWRLQFDDANDTWVTIAEHTGAIVQVSDGHRRVDRWLFAFLHSFDLPQLLAARPAWDAWMLVFSLAGLGLSLTGVVTGWRRLRRKARPARAAAGLAGPVGQAPG
ncbi:conserved membrane hypothetical protein [Rubrivivax sp. A210]|uniref:PepSY domain-containing protein n=1 Tax=Rubrivivax sp. A210 TaxID=2772301 RepID=UPI0019C43407|nr:PepSY domain-containing protein [Rubrivivax sp. A210]CAD5370257.1 conserved membrane hypothetical protein [Rubrivivax sp. A210]